MFTAFVALPRDNELLLWPRKKIFSMKYLVLFLFATLAIACNDSGVSAQNGDPVVGEVDSKAPLRQDPKDKGRDVPGLVFRMGEATAKKGQVVCLPIETSGFKDLLAFQYTVRFDSAALVFHSVRGLNLPGYRTNNFGTRFTERGYLSTLWTSEDVINGVTLPDDHRVYELCFTSQLGKNEETEVKFQNGPTMFEVVGPEMARYRLVYANGKVTGK